MDKNLVTWDDFQLEESLGFVAADAIVLLMAQAIILHLRMQIVVKSSLRASI